MHFCTLYKVEPQIKISLVIALTLSGQDGGDLLQVLAVGHTGLVFDPVLEVRLHNGANGNEGGRHGDAGIVIDTFLSVFIHSVGYKKRLCISHKTRSLQGRTLKIVTLRLLS